MRFKAWHGLSEGYRAAVEGHSPWSADARNVRPIAVEDVAAEPSLAYWLSRMSYPEFPEPMGVFRCVEAPIYDQQVAAQLRQATKQYGEGDLAALFNAGDTWTVR